MHRVGRQRLGRPHQRRIDAHPRARSARAPRPSARRRNCASHATAEPARRPRSRRSTSGAARPRCPAARPGAPRPSSRRRRPTGIRRRYGPGSPPAVEPADDAGDAQLAQNMAEHHRGDDIAAARVEEDDAPQLGVRAAGFEEIDEGLRRLASITPSATMTCGTTSRRSRAMSSGSTRKRHRRRRARRAAAGVSASRERDATPAPNGAPRSAERLVGGDGLEPPTLSV